MKAFKYKLQRVLDARDAVVSRCQCLLSDSERLLNQHHSRQRSCLSALQESKDIHARQMENQKIKARECRIRQTWINNLENQLSRAVNAANTQLHKVNNHRQALQVALIDRKIMENLSKREQKEWLAEIRKTDQKVTDEQGSYIYLKNRSNNPPISSLEHIQ